LLSIYELLNEQQWYECEGGERKEASILRADSVSEYSVSEADE
jgi:hypothetical protein